MTSTPSQFMSRFSSVWGKGSEIIGCLRYNSGDASIVKITCKSYLAERPKYRSCTDEKFQKLPEQAHIVIKISCSHNGVLV